jgi:hypothetical protein
MQSRKVKTPEGERKEERKEERKGRGVVEPCKLHLGPLNDARTCLSIIIYMHRAEDEENKEKEQSDHPPWPEHPPGQHVCTHK